MRRFLKIDAHPSNINRTQERDDCALQAMHINLQGEVAARYMQPWPTPLFLKVQTARGKPAQSAIALRLHTASHVFTVFLNMHLNANMSTQRAGNADSLPTAATRFDNAPCKDL